MALKERVIKEPITPADPGLPDFIKITEEAFDHEALIKSEIAALYDKPDKVVSGTGEPVHVGIDSEYVPLEDSVVVLCYSYCIIGRDSILKGVIYPAGREYKHRWSFEKTIGHILHRALKEGVIDVWPKVTFVYGFFLRADVGSFKSFWRCKDQVDGLRGTVSTMRRGYGVQHEVVGKRRAAVDPIRLRNINGRVIQTYVNFVDVKNQTPGREGLSAVGEMLDLKKLEIPEPYCITRMDELLAGDQDFFEQYAIRDAEIAVRYGLEMHAFVKNTLGLKKLPLTIGACAVAYFRKTVGDADYFNEVFGVDYVKSQQWNQKDQYIQKRKRKVETVSRRLFSQFAADCFHGGRNECYTGGPTDVL